MKLLLSIMAAFLVAGTLWSQEGPPEGGFQTFHVQAEDPYEYIEFLKENPQFLAAGGGDVVGYCMTMSGHDYPGEMFIWNGYSSLENMMGNSNSYNPYGAPTALKNMRTIKYSSYWKTLTPFDLAPGFERVTRVKVKPENVLKFLQATEVFEAAVKAAGEDFQMAVFQPIGGGPEGNTLMIRGFAKDGQSMGALFDKGYAGAAWGQSLAAMQSLVDSFERDSIEQCEILLENG
tara:strand:- start:830 stop:1528 length:699 start_codon:yes stop_codon:yes gene_type:complete